MTTPPLVPSWYDKAAAWRRLHRTTVWFALGVVLGFIVGRVV